MLPPSLFRKVSFSWLVSPYDNVFCVFVRMPFRLFVFLVTIMHVTESTFFVCFFCSFFLLIYVVLVLFPPSSAHSSYFCVPSFLYRDERFSWLLSSHFLFLSCHVFSGLFMHFPYVFAMFPSHGVLILPPIDLFVLLLRASTLWFLVRPDGFVVVSCNLMVSLFCTMFFFSFFLSLFCCLTVIVFLVRCALIAEEGRYTSRPLEA